GGGGVRPGPGARHGARPRPLAAAARGASRPRAEADADADGRRRDPPRRRGHPRRAGADAARAREVTALARIAVEQAGAVTVAAVDGEIDASNAADIGHRLRLLVDNRARALIVDL